MNITNEVPPISYRVVIELTPTELSRILADLGEADERDCIDYDETRDIYDFLEGLR